jgi:glycerophosphoryl diester phosphodiesterase
MVYVVGHRGAAGVMPENTIKGFRYAIALGVDAVECDVHLSRDKQLVVMHDSTVDRTTNGRGAIRDLALARIRTLDAGEGEPVPTLEELLETVRNEVHLLIELKGIGVERAAVEAVKAQGMVDDVTFSSFALERLAAVRSMGKQYRVRAILPNPTDFELARAVAIDAVGIDVRYQNACFRVIEAAQAMGLEVLAWNPDTWREQQVMIGLGVEGVSTNRPDLLLEQLGRKVEAGVVVADTLTDTETSGRSSGSIQDGEEPEE